MIPTIRNGIQMASQDIALISNNLANAGTTGFKRSRSEFHDTYGKGMNSMPNIDIGHGARSDGPRRSFTQGQIKPSGSELDLAVSGVGMFGTVRLEDADQNTFGVADQFSFTRDGSFRLDEEGRVVTTDGRAVIREDGELMVVPLERLDENGDRQLLTALNIGDDGGVEATYAGGAVVDLGNVGLFNFANIGALTAIGNGHFTVSAESGPAQIGRPRDNNFGRILSGNLETANVNVTNELTKLMQAQQAYSASSRLLQSAVDVTKKLIG